MKRVGSLVRSIFLEKDRITLTFIKPEFKDEVEMNGLKYNIAWVFIYILIVLVYVTKQSLLIKQITWIVFFILVFSVKFLEFTLFYQKIKDVENLSIYHNFRLKGHRNPKYGISFPLAIYLFHPDPKILEKTVNPDDPIVLIGTLMVYEENEALVREKLTLEGWNIDGLRYVDQDDAKPNFEKFFFNFPVLISENSRIFPIMDIDDFEKFRGFSTRELDGTQHLSEPIIKFYRMWEKDKKDMIWDHGYIIFSKMPKSLNAMNIPELKRVSHPKQFGEGSIVNE